MTAVQIDPNFEMTTGQAARMLGLTTWRVKSMCSQGMVPCEKKGDGEIAHYRIKFKDLDKVFEADGKMKKLGKNVLSNAAVMDRFTDLEARIELLEQLYDMNLAPDASPR